MKKTIGITLLIACLALSIIACSAPKTEQKPVSGNEDNQKSDGQTVSQPAAEHSSPSKPTSNREDAEQGPYLIHSIAGKNGEAFIVDENTSFEIKGYEDAVGIQFIAKQEGEAQPLVLEFDADVTNGWSMKGPMPGKGNVSFYGIVQKKDGTTEKLEVLNLVSQTDNDNLFDAKDVKNGDKVKDWTIASMNLAKDGALGYAGTIEFNGKATLSGMYSYIPEDVEFFGGNICFTPDEESAKLLPKMMNDRRPTFFCASNLDEIKDKFGKPGDEGNTQLEIEKFIIDYRPTETWNRADIIVK